MAVPTLTSITPNVGHSGGKTLVEIVGADFTLPPAPVATGPTTDPGPSVQVLVGGRPVTAISLVSPTLLYCLTPKGDPDVPQDVVIRNLAIDGTPVPGEEATIVGGFTFQRPDLREESDLQRIVRTFALELKRQVLDNVSFSTHTDWDADTGDLLNLAYVQEVPALILGNMEIPENRAYATNYEEEFQAASGFYIRRRGPVVVDVNLTLVGVAKNPMQMLNLMHVTRTFFAKNPWLEVDRMADDPTKGFVKFDLVWSFGGPVSVTHQGDNSNIESFGGSVQIKGIRLEDMPGITSAAFSGIPAGMSHEATVHFGPVTADDASAVQVNVQKKDE